MLADTVFQNKGVSAPGFPLLSPGYDQPGVYSPPQDVVTHVTGATDALPNYGTVAIDSTGVDACTLATPTAGTFGTGDDGKILRIVDTGGHAHTVTTAANKIVPSHHVLTFGGTAGSWIELEIIGGLFYPKGSSGVTIS